MLRRFRMRIADEQGFTLVELLVSMLILGLLAGFGVPSFLGQGQKASDVDAKANARNGVSAIEICFTQTRNYATCDTAEELEAAGTKLASPLTDTTTKKHGAISVTATEDTYMIVAYSSSKNEFAITKAANGTSTRTCSTAGQGGCRPGSVW